DKTVDRRDGRLSDHSAGVPTLGRRQSVQRSDLDFPITDPGLVRGLGYRGRAAHDGAVGQPKGTAMPRADDAAIGKLTFIQWTAVMAAGVRQRGDLSLIADQQHR